MKIHDSIFFSVSLAPVRALDAPPPRSRSTSPTSATNSQAFYRRIPDPMQNVIINGTTITVGINGRF